MSLGTRLTLKTAVLVLAVVVVAVAALWGLGGLNRDLDDALGEYDRLRGYYTLMITVEQARAESRKNPPDISRISQTLERARFQADNDQALMDRTTAIAIAERIAVLIKFLDEYDQSENFPPFIQIQGELHSLMNLLADLADSTAAKIKQIELDANARRTRVVLIVTATAGIAALLAIIVGVWQYLAVMNPMRRLGKGVRLLASGQFDSELKASGDREFVALANDFNRMADELATLYRELEDKVRLRSAQLAQSERLASVGFLAAGVAHEINNPLAIIAGEAELALSALSEDANAELRQSLTTTRDEAFRCKGITQKLLSLARPGSGAPEAINLYQLAKEVASLVKSLPQHEGRKLVIEGDRALSAASEPSQIKQVLLNLVINALEAVPEHTGQVRIACHQQGDRAALSVIDNGKGIDAEALPRVFEPFYTEKKSPTTPGLGLGLSISHAIVEDLGGRLTADSPGVNRGSTFTIELPIGASR